jgi:hypothetical protein
LRCAARRLQLAPDPGAGELGAASAGQTYGLTGDQLTPRINTSAYGLREAWNAAKPVVAPWWAENSKEAYAAGCANLAAALGNRRAGRAGAAARGGPLVRQLEDLLGVWHGESQAGPVRADVRVHGVRARPAVAPLREGSITTQRHLREAVAR